VTERPHGERDTGFGDPGPDDGAGSGTERNGLPPGVQQFATLLADGLADFANATIGLDAAGAARLGALEGNRVLIRSQVPQGLPGPAGLSFTLEVRGGRLRLLPGAAATPNAIVTGGLADLAGWAVSRGRHTPPGLRLEGDTRLLETLAEIAADYRPDLERPLGRIVGAGNANRMIAAAEVAFAGLRSLLQGAATGAKQGAGRWFATHAALDAFLDELDQLRLDVDRLGARVAAAERRAAERPESGPPSVRPPPS
jgi:ubiquinone biosynthesis protein UbiJ